MKKDSTVYARGKESGPRKTHLSVLGDKAVPRHLHTLPPGWEVCAPGQCLQPQPQDSQASPLPPCQAVSSPTAQQERRLTGHGAKLWVDSKKPQEIRPFCSPSAWLQVTREPL